MHPHTDQIVRIVQLAFLLHMLLSSHGNLFRMSSLLLLTFLLHTLSSSQGLVPHVAIAVVGALCGWLQLVEVK